MITFACSQRILFLKLNILTWFWLFLISSVLFLNGEDVGGTKKMNVLFMIADDMNGDVSVLGHPIVKTPNMERLATKGINFTNARCNFALCNPSRTSFLSGRYPETTKIFGNETPPRTYLGNVTMLEEYFHEHGYFTARCGKIGHDTFASAFKWDLDAEDAPNYHRKPQRVKLEDGKDWIVKDEDELDELHEKKSKSLALFVNNYNEASGMRFLLGAAAGKKSNGESRWEYGPTDERDEENRDGAMARYISQVIEQHKDKPFFIAAGFRKPHTPWFCPKKYIDMYPPSAIKLPHERGEPVNDRDDIPSPAFTNFPDYKELSDDKRREAIGSYYGCISLVDAGIGVLLDTVDRLNLWENTIVIFVSDHGYQLGEHGGLARKQTEFEECSHIPLIIAAPGSPAGVTCPRPVELIDFYPTLTEFCKLPAPDGLQGASFVSLLNHPEGEWARPSYSVVTRGKIMGHSVHNDQYRYTRWEGGENGGNQEELYDLKADPNEYTNLAKKSESAGVLSEMKKLLEEAKQRPK
jgi:iduronate 2-sulfatase